MKSLITLILAALLLVSCNITPGDPAQNTSTPNDSENTAQITIAAESEEAPPPSEEKLWRGYEKCDANNPYQHMCNVHTEYYHFWERYFGDSLLTLVSESPEDYAELKSEYEIWRDTLIKDGADGDCYTTCHWPDMNVAAFVEKFDIPRWAFDYAINYLYPEAKDVYDLDAVYGGDSKRAEEAFAMTEDKVEAINKNHLAYKNEAEIKWSLSDFVKSQDPWHKEFMTYDEETRNAYIFVTSLPTELRTRVDSEIWLRLVPICPDEKELNAYALTVRTNPRRYSIATLVKLSGVNKTDLEKIIEESFIYGDARFTYDLDKLYSNLDYYADLLGTEGYEYPWQVDALIIK